MAFTPTTGIPALQAANIGFTGLIQTANTAKDGTGTVSTLFTAGATNGSRAFRVTGLPAGSNVASVLRIFLNNGGATSTAANNVLIAEVDLPLTTLTEVAAQSPVVKEFNLDIPPGGSSWRLTCAIGTTVAAGWYFSCTGRDY